jgi:hypothetical protein
MESDGDQSRRQLDDLARRRDALRARLAFPWWWYAAWAFTLGWPGVLFTIQLLFPIDGDLFYGYLLGFVLSFALFLYARRSRGLRLGVRRPRNSPKEIAAGVAAVALGIGVLIVALQLEQPWLVVGLCLGSAAMAGVSAYRKRYEQPLADEQP